MLLPGLFTENPNALSRASNTVGITQTTINFKMRNCFRINTAKFVIIHVCLVAAATVLVLELLLCCDTSKIIVYNLVLL